MTAIEQGATYLLNAAGITLVQLLMLGGPGLLLIAVLSWLSGYVRRFAVAVLGMGFYHLFFGWLGTTIHEIGHLLAALIFGHKIASFQAFRLNPYAKVRGSVGVTFPAGNLYNYIGLFFFGIAPVVFGPLVIYLA